MDFQRIQVVDSHTAGEPTRVVIAGGPDLGGGSMAERRTRFGQQHDWFRSAVVNEPRGSDVLVGAILCEPTDPACVAGVIFFNNAGYLNMCGHGTMGVAVTLAHLGRVTRGVHRLETPVGIVSFEYHGPLTLPSPPGGETRVRGSGRVTIENVPSYRLAAQVPLEVPGFGSVHGDVAWGGNWFYLVADHGQELSLANVDRLTDLTWRIRQELPRQGVTGRDGTEIDHIELLGPAQAPGVDGRNFVLCPGKAYDRSPCGTGTSAKLACLYADGKLREGETWRQESIIGSVFEGSIRRDGPHLIPRITGSAFVCAEATLLLDPDDPFRTGIHG